MTALILIVAAFAAGAMNSVAGGGSLLTFPALVFGGVPPVIANASSTVALFPGSFASAWAYRRDFQPVEGVALGRLIAASLAGGIAGAILLLSTPESWFDVIVPWLLLAATLLFAFGRQATPVLQRLFRIGPRTLVAIQFVVAIYGGYFGGAVGILQLAIYGLFGLTDINAMNANKTLLTGTMNAIAVVCFVIAGKVWWLDTLLMLGGAVLGGYAGARIGRRIDPGILRVVITAIGLVMTAVFFVRR